ncbi:phage integrase SAM-like domain-containing protein [Gluconobacter kondonii]|uniref:phage integrase SAM-like domain-containing protein n=1 Tax=Gluconobacter kondonii TaxID=941463 RepID=UPI001B8C6F07|nr:phage integrase SAM-like domain-containing protein [Gluconobacter kondonii]MBS1080384.1 phage integrase SAM-like domain-containing protein [Gluconobacter kondonii]
MNASRIGTTPRDKDCFSDREDALGSLLDRWHQELNGQVTNELLDRHRLSLRYLGEFLVGTGTGDPTAHVLSLRLSDVTKREVSGFREWMIQTKGIQPLTVGFRLSCLKSFWDWASDAGLTDAPNPWQGAARGLKRRAEKALKPNGEKRPFTEAELLALLSADPQTNRNGKWGPAIYDTFRLGLLTGARQNELASLSVGRVIQSDSPDVLWGLRVTADVGKTKSAIRRIPLHPIARAIVERRLRALSQGSGQEALLFPECVPGGRDEKHGHYLSKRFATFRQAVLGGESPTDFHSTRRCFATFMATALANGVSECSELVRDHLIGHRPMALGSNTYAAKDLGWDLYSRAIIGMAEKGIPEAVRRALST